MTAERVQKVLSRMGFGSRREIERWIEQGRIKINGKPCELGDHVKDGDWVHVDGKRVIVRERTQETTRVIMYHKPEGEVCTRSDPEGRPTVFDHLPKAKRARWISIGRLDINTSGLLLFTTNGELANRLMHPSQQIEREYAVRVNGDVSRDTLRQLTTGVTLEDGPAHFDDIQDGGGEGYNRWYYVVIREGRKREVRRLWEAVGVRVSRLIRVRYGAVILPKSLRKRRVKELDEDTIKQLGESVGLALEVEARPDRTRRSSPAGAWATRKSMKKTTKKTVKKTTKKTAKKTTKKTARKTVKKATKKTVVKKKRGTIKRTR